MAADDGDLFIDDCGSGPPVVLLHGTPSDPRDFQPLVEALAGHHRVLVPHLPGYGKTPYRGVQSIASIMVRIEDAVLRSGISEARVVGFSGGAYKALAMALGKRVHVPRLALLAPVIGLDANVAQAYRDMITAVRAKTFDPRPTWLDRMASPGFATRDPAGATRILAWLDGVSSSVLNEEIIALADAPDLRPRLSELDCRLLVCAGTADNAVPIAWSKAVADSVRGASFTPIQGAGHALLVETPLVVTRLLVTFLKEE